MRGGSGECTKGGYDQGFNPAPQFMIPARNWAEGRHGMKKTIAFFIVTGLLAAGAVFGRYTIALADDWGFGYGETHPCQTCSETSMFDLNQYELKDTDPGEHVSQTYWNPLPGEEGRYLWMCGYRGGATGGDLAYAIRVYYQKEGANYRSHLDGWEIPGDGGRGFPLTFGNGWKVKAKWYEDSVTNTRPCSDVDLTTNTCYYSNGTSEQCDALSVGSDGHYHCVTTIKGWVFGDETQIVSGKQAEALCRDVNPHIGWVQTTDEYDLPPCQTIKVVQEEGGSVTIGCTMHYYNASVSVSFCAAVDRKPYPRAMTGKPVFFSVSMTQEYKSTS